MTYLRLSAVLTLALFCGQTSSAEPLFFESFESGDMSGTNEAGFGWSFNNGTSVVTMDPLPLNVWENGAKTEYDADTSKDWTAKAGDYSLRFRYAPVGSGEQPQWTEQRFNLGGEYPEIWIQYWVRVPVNYYHATDDNHKFFAIWMDGYEGHGQGATVVWETRGSQNGDGRGHVAVRYRYELNGGYNSGHQQKTFFIHPSDAGRWMEITLHVKASSTQTAADGVIEMWRRWENEASPVKFHTWTDAVLPIPDTGDQGFNAGYFFGWANKGWPNETEWLIDHIAISISSESLPNNQGLINSSDAPNPPSSISIN